MIRLIVLGMLARQSMHGYDLIQQLEKDRVDLWSNVLPGSIYHALRQLAKEGCVQIRDTERSGNKTRAVYEITPQGSELLLGLIAEAMSVPSTEFPSAFYAALFMMGRLPKKEVIRCLEQQITGLEHKIALWNKGEPGKAELSGNPRLVRQVFANGIAHMELDLQLLKQIKQDLEES
ncbi:PadR family transcriptional regulator [Paenibacillus tyrfis]|uniref:PadR family transcriptional regulator n=1 Tax=Paenibacillus tyrfis TaxID=1501230 RepID=UPI002493A6B6|nr:PadR family transcriptional regulator [Paenibacillus tyrfis]GLI08825.1 PadR family transcriptional regulator [Paenibacillus tyrfis]